MLQWIKDHVTVISFFIGILTTVISGVVYLDMQQAKRAALELVDPMMKDIHDEILINRQETLTNRKHTDEVEKKVDELEKQSIGTHTKLDFLIQMLKKEFKPQ